uniref:BCL2 family apoptosis regulator BOK n=1 Tax=Ailuropoda melanoleuca TaxID=9646 RepID=A0A7N5KQE8_AILME
MEVLRRSSVFAAEIMDAFDRSPTDKELVAQAKALGREFVHARLLRAGLAWSAPERAAPVPGGRLAEVCAVLLRLGDELELIRPSVYRNVARQLNISLQSETVVTDAFLAVASQIFSGEPVATLWNPRGLRPHPHLLRASTEKPKGHDTHSGSRGHLLVGDVKMLSHGLGSGRHGDCLFKFAFRIQPEFSGDLSRTNTNTLVLPSKGGPATGQVFGSRSTCRPRCQRPVGRVLASG